MNFILEEKCFNGLDNPLKIIYFSNKVYYYIIILLIFIIGK